MKRGCFERCCGFAVDEELNDFTNVRGRIRLVFCEVMMIARSSEWGSLVNVFWKSHIMILTIWNNWGRV